MRQPAGVPPATPFVLRADGGAVQVAGDEPDQPASACRGATGSKGFEGDAQRPLASPM